ncbi:MAG TPA: tetratricopeptide repeat protein [Polyangiaceae bacterium]
MVNTGIDRYKRHDYEGARAMFSRAYDADPSQVEIVFNLALAELQSGHPVDAARHLRAYVASPQAQPERVASARSKWLPDAEAEVGRLSIEAPAGTQVSVDGATLGTAPFVDPVYVAPGEHDLRAQTGSEERTMHISAVAGETISVRFLMKDAPPTPPPASPPPASAGSIENPAAVDEAPPPPRGPQPAKVATVLGLGVAAVAAAGVALGFGVGSQTAENHADDLRSSLKSTSACYPGLPSIPAACTQLQSAISAQGRDYKLQLGFYTGAGVLAVAAVATWFLWPRRTAQTSWSVQPAFDARSASAQIVGAF